MLDEFNWLEKRDESTNKTYKESLLEFKDYNDMLKRLIQYGES